MAEADVDVGVQRQEPVVDREHVGIGQRVGRGVGRAILGGGGQGGERKSEGGGGAGNGHGRIS